MSIRDPGRHARLGELAADVVAVLGYTVVLLSNEDRVLLPALRRTQEILTGARLAGR